MVWSESRPGDRFLVRAVPVIGVGLIVIVGLIWLAAWRARRVIGMVRFYADELTEKSRTAAASEQRFRDLAALSSDCLWQLDRELRFSYLSGRVADVLGLEREDLLGLTPWQAIGERSVAGDGDAWREHCQTLERHDAFQRFRYRMIDSTGRRRTIEDSGKPVFDEHGAFVGYFGVSCDITGYIDAQERAQLAQAHLSVVIDHMAEGFELYDADDRLVRWNRALTQIYDRIAEKFTVGVHHDELLAAAVKQGLIDTDGVAVDDYLRERKARRRELRGLVEQRLSDGRWVQISERPTQDGGIVSLVRDITEIKRREQALRDSEERFRAIADATPLPMAINFKDSGSIVYANKQFESVLGLPPGGRDRPSDRRHVSGPQHPEGRGGAA